MIGAPGAARRYVYRIVRQMGIELDLQVVKAYEEQGFSMLLNAFNDPKYLEKLTGLDKLFEEGEAALKDVEWMENEEEDDF